jgi:hypothetical protein
MSAVLPIDFSSIQIGNLVGPHPPFRLPISTPEATLHIVVPEFKFSLLVPLEELAKHVDSTRVNVKFAVDEWVTLTLALIGRSLEDGEMFEPGDGSLGFDLADHNAPRAQFVGTTLMAMLGLAKEVPLQVPEIGLNLGMRFTIPLININGMLLTRQLTHALMVIERATGLQFKLLPESLYDKEERDALAFTYYAIAERSFTWPLNDPIGALIFVNEDTLARFPGEGKTFQYKGPVKPIVKTVMGQSISLGEGQIHIADAVFSDPIAARREVEQGKDGMAAVAIYSLSGQARFEFPEAPRLPKNPWDWKLQALIDLEPKFDVHLADAYHALAAATLADLSEEEKAQVTSRPLLDEGAHLMGDQTGE